MAALQVCFPCTIDVIFSPPFLLAEPACTLRTPATSRPLSPRPWTMVAFWPQARRRFERGAARCRRPRPGPSTSSPRCGERLHPFRFLPLTFFDPGRTCPPLCFKPVLPRPLPTTPRCLRSGSRAGWRSHQAGAPASGARCRSCRRPTSCCGEWRPTGAPWRARSPTVEDPLKKAPMHLRDDGALLRCVSAASAQPLPPYPRLT